MKIKRLLCGVILTCLASVAAADLEPYKDYEVGEMVSNVTTVKVDSNMIDKYLEGLRDTWVTGNEVAMELGHIDSYSIYVSELPESGDFNVVLVVRMQKIADMQPSEAKYDAFMAKWAADNEEKTDKIVQTYPDIRTITGEYLLREITIK